MVNRKPQVLVVGGGPAGSITGRVSAEGGADTLLIDKKTDLAESSACGGLVSLETWERLGASDQVIENEIRGVFVHPPEGESFDLSAPETKAYVIDRDELNADLATRAKKKGVKVKTGTGIYRRDDRSVTIRSVDGSEEERLEPRVIIGADGPRSDVRRLFALERPSKLLYAIQEETEFTSRRSDFVEVFFGKDLAPGFFGWIIPVSRNRARIGLATSRGERIKHLFANLAEKIGIEPTDAFRTGVIPIGVPESPCKNGVLTVGDAAGQVKPTSGGGIYPLSITARIAGEVAIEAVNGLEKPGRVYYDRWMNEVGEELKREMLLHRILDRVSDKRLTRLLSLLKREEIASWISRNGEIDHLYPLAKKMIKDPAVVTTILKTLPGEIGSKLMDELR
ncbi:MAG: geranylgeranyl reductase family protein [Candidatus Bipolaricaulota bacterium]